jgi:hypothetical protein
MRGIFPLSGCRLKGVETLLSALPHNFIIHTRLMKPYVSGSDIRQ